MSSYTRNGKYTNAARIEGKVVVITGANTGLGKATAIDLAKRGGKVYMACRSEERGMAALKEVQEVSGSQNVIFMKLDLASLDSVRDFSGHFHDKESRLDILINNAGLLSPLERTKDGFELNMGVNHLGHFLLTNLLLDLLKAASPSRIVVVSSQIHSWGTINKDDFNSEKSFSGSFKAYGSSKLANILFTRKLAKDLNGTGVTVNCLCPGGVDTEATRYLNVFMRWIFIPIKKLFHKTPEQGAQTQIMLAVEPALEKTTGGYFVDCVEKSPSAAAQDEKLGDWLWKKSEELTGM